MWSARRVGIILAYAAIPLLLVIGSVALAVTEAAPVSNATSAATSNPATATRTNIPEPTDTKAGTSTMPSATTAAKLAASPASSPTSKPPTTSPTAAAQPTGASPAASPPTASAATPNLAVTPRAEKCGPLLGWSRAYVVKPGDTLFRIALRYRTSVWQLRQANCKDITAVFPGEELWVPGFKTRHWDHRSLPAFRWHWWEQLPWSGRGSLAPVP